jgi:hypothetical protein
VAGTVIVGLLSGQQVHRSRARCNDFSCRCQSYLAGNVSVQNVHWKIRADRDLACCWAVLCVIGARRRRRRSEDPFDRLDWLDMEDPKVNSEFEDSRVSKLEVDGALNIENAAEESSDEFLRELARDPGFDECVEVRPGSGVLVTARAIAVMEAGSFSGGEAFHLSRGFKFVQSPSDGCLAGMSIAPSIGDDEPDGALTLPLLRAFASQFEI